MRPQALFASLSLLLLGAQANAEPAAIDTHVESPASEATKGTVADVKTDGGASEATTFNAQSVPPIRFLVQDGVDFATATAKGYWLVEFFSPYCHHCKAFAPIWQTLYELYYTSDPLPAAADNAHPLQSLNSFTRYYDLQFAKVDCAAFGDTCTTSNIESFPTVVLLKDGVEIKRNKGYKDLPGISKFLEEILESIKPGSRPKDGLDLPKVGADHAPGFDSSSTANKVKNVAAGAAGVVAEKLGSVKEKAGNLATDTLSLSDASSDMLDMTTSTKSSLASKKANADGKSVVLTADLFEKQVSSSRDPWFIKFYAPWCHHCQAMQSTWQAMARDMRGKLNIGEVNCEVEKRLCKDVGVRGFPTIAFFQGVQRVDYDGLRGLGDLIGFAKKAVDANNGVQDVNAAQFEALEKEEEVIFVYVYDHATTTEDFAALERLQMPLIGHAKLVKTNDELLYQRFKVSTWPRLLVSRDGKPTYFTALAPKDIRNHNKVLDWMKTVWQPLVPELTTTNAREIMNGKLVVLGILSRSRSDEFVIAKREIKNAAIEWIEKQNQAFILERQELRDAKQLRIEEAEDRNDQRALRAAKSIRIDMDDIQRKEVGFAWVDGVFWERWIKTTFGINVKDGERVVVNDESNHKYWDTTITGNPIVPSRTSILETLSKIVASPPKILPKSSTMLRHTLHYIPDKLSGHRFLIGFVALGLLLALYAGRHVISARLGRGNKAGFFQLPISAPGGEKATSGLSSAPGANSGHGTGLGSGLGVGVMNGLLGGSNSHGSGKKD